MKAASILRICITVALLALLTGCATVTYWNDQDSCSKNEAYQRGIHDARHNRPIRADYGSSCMGLFVGDVRSAYVRGYQNGLEASRWAREPRGGYRNANPAGYYNGPAREDDHLVTTRHRSLPNTIPAQKQPRPEKMSDGRMCLEDNTGEKVCGYSCKRSPKGVKCSAKPEHNCLTDAFGNIHCGQNCQRNLDQIICDENHAQSSQVKPTLIQRQHHAKSVSPKHQQLAHAGGHGKTDKKSDEKNKLVQKSAKN